MLPYALKQLKPINRRAEKVHREYCEAAKDLDSKLSMIRFARSNPLFCRSGPWRASKNERFSGSAPAASGSYLLD